MLSSLGYIVIFYDMCHRKASEFLNFQKTMWYVILKLFFELRIEVIYFNLKYRKFGEIFVFK